MALKQKLLEWADTLFDFFAFVVIVLILVLGMLMWVIERYTS